MKIDQYGKFLQYQCLILIHSNFSTIEKSNNYSCYYNWIIKRKIEILKETQKIEENCVKELESLEKLFN